MRERDRKRIETVNRKWGSWGKMLEERLHPAYRILGGYNGGIRRVKKGFARMDKERFREMVENRERDSRGRFISKADAQRLATDRERDARAYRDEVHSQERSVPRSVLPQEECTRPETFAINLESSGGDSESKNDQ